MKIIRPVTVTDAGTFTRASTGTYVNSAGVIQTAAINVARFSYQANNLPAGPAMIVEAAATNEVPYSENLSVWSNNVSSFIANYDIAPDGTTTSTLISSGTRYIYMTLVPGQRYIASFYVRPAASGDSFWAYVEQIGITGVGARFDNGVLTTTQESGLTVPIHNITADIETTNNGWRRVWMNFTAQQASYVIHAFPNSVFMEFWGFQVEIETPSKKPSSYIKTTSAPTTRAADVNTTTLISNIPETDYSVWNAATYYVIGDRVLDLTTHKVYQSTTGVVGTGTLTIASPGTVAIAGASVLPTAGTPVRFTTNGALPTGLVAGTTYYVHTVGSSTFTVTASVGGSQINFTGSQSGTHTVQASNNLNKVVTDASVWTLVGSDNRWSMFDQSITSQSTNAGGIVVAITPGTRVDSVVGLNCGAYQVTVNMYDQADGLVFSERQILVADSGINDWYDYFFQPIESLTEFVVDGLPAGYSGATTTVSITSVAGTPAIGGLVLGLSREIGDTEANAKVGTVDYTVKTKDAFGNYSVTPRAFSKRADFTVKIPTSTVDTLQALLASYRAIPVVYIGSNDSADEQYRSTIIYGFYKDFSIDISYPPLSTCTLQVEGLT